MLPESVMVQDGLDNLLVKTTSDLTLARPSWTKMGQHGLKRSILVGLGPPTVLWQVLTQGSPVLENG